MANFFINRPIFAWVLAILLCLTGTLAIFNLSVEQYPNLAPPNVMISATYPGASAETVDNTVTQNIEQSMTGIDNLVYMSSQSSNNGQASIELTFSPGTDPDEAMQQVQSQLNSVLKRLPQAVQTQGVTVRKVGSSNFLTVAFVSTDGSMTSQDIADYIASHVQDPLSRINGVGEVDPYGSQYAMRIWLDPNKLYAYSLTTEDVINAIKAQNAQVAVGQLGGMPQTAHQALNATVNAQSLLQTPQQFRQITLRVNQDGSAVTLGDVAKVELGAENYNYITLYNGHAATGMGIKLAAGANEVQTDERVHQEIAALSHYFPRGLQAHIAYEETPFVKASIKDVVQTLLEAVVLVFGVMYLFMQNFRATLIPTIAVPVVLLGTCSILYLCGFSLNTLTMFAMVLAIGLLVDDAIVVVENVERIMHSEGLSPLEATRKSMGQIQGALVGISLVLSAVFVPMAFFGGTVGEIYRQFSVTIVSAMCLSVLVAMILTPALCATLLEPITPDHAHSRKGFFVWFNHHFNKNADRYQQSVSKILGKTGRWFLLYGVLLGIVALLFLHLPTSFLPAEDSGIFMTMVQLPSGSTMNETKKVVEKVENYYLHQDKKDVQSVFSVIGAGPGGNGQNVAFLFVRLKDWSQRTASADSSFAIINRATQHFSTLKQAIVIAFSPAAISGLGSASGFDMELEDHAGSGHQALMKAGNELLAMARANPNLSNVRHNGMDDSPQLQINIDQRKAEAMGLSMDDINNTLSTAWGSSYVDDFLDQGRTKKVYVQAEAKYRMLPDDIYKWYVRNSSDQMVPFGAFATSYWTSGSPLLERYNGYPAMEIIGEPSSGTSSGTAMTTMEKLVAKLPTGFGLEWTGSSYQERLNGKQAPALYAISLLVIFLSLAALYESWSIPFSVMLAVPLGVFGALIATWMRGLDNDVYFQVGLLTVVGLTAKNAILIVEFANSMNRQGMALLEAALQAARLRLRPIIMTSLAFGLGVLPMTLASGAGCNSQHAVGTGVLGGMITATLLAIFFVPLFFVQVRRRFPLKPSPAVSALSATHLSDTKGTPASLEEKSDGS